MSAKIPVWGKVLKFENHLKNVVFVYYLPCVTVSFWPPYTPVVPLCVQFAAVLQEIRKIITTRCFTCCETKLPSSHPVKCGLRGIKWVVREAWQRRRLSSGLLFTLSLHLSLSLTHTNKQEVVWSSKDGVKQTGLHTSHLLLSQSKKQNQKSNNDLRGASPRHRAGRQGHWGSGLVTGIKIKLSVGVFALWCLDPPLRWNWASWMSHRSQHGVKASSN